MHRPVHAALFFVFPPLSRLYGMPRSVDLGSGACAVLLALKHTHTRLTPEELSLDVLVILPDLTAERLAALIKRWSKAARETGGEPASTCVQTLLLL